MKQFIEEAVRWVECTYECCSGDTDKVDLLTIKMLHLWSLHSYDAALLLRLHLSLMLSLV